LFDSNERKRTSAVRSYSFVAPCMSRVTGQTVD